MTNNVYGIDLGTCNMKIYCKASNKIMNEKNTIALVNKNEMYAYGDDAYAMYEKAPETIQVTFPVVGGVIADFNNLQVMLQTYLEAHAKGKLRGAEFIVAVPTVPGQVCSTVVGTNDFSIIRNIQSKTSIFSAAGICSQSLSATYLTTRNINYYSIVNWIWFFVVNSVFSHT